MNVAKDSNLAKTGNLPYRYDKTHNSVDIKANYAKLEGKEVSVAGRVMSVRSLGGVRFFDLRDGEGDIQIMILRSNLTKEMEEIVDSIGRGDIIGVRGVVTKSNAGEISVSCKEATLLAKNLRPLPEKFHGLTDVEERYRNRTLDLIANLKSREIFKTRAKILTYIRSFLDSRGFIEFETPVLQPTYGGAFAKPFITHLNALNQKMYLRIADELYLKRLIISGYEAVYEVSKDFRNEDIDSTHNPEFTQVEFYQAYRDYEDFMKLTEELFRGMVRRIFNTYTITYQSHKLDFSKPFQRIYWVDEIKKQTGIDVAELDDEKAKIVAKQENLSTSILNAQHVADELLDKYVKPSLIQPSFVIDYPVYMSPLTRRKRGNPKLTERFEFYMGGIEIGNCYSELNNPIEQRKRFEEQEIERKKGDIEAPPSDRDFLEVMEYGMPPTAGIGICIERIAMILTDNPSIKEVILFPLVKEQGAD